MVFSRSKAAKPLSSIEMGYLVFLILYKSKKRRTEKEMVRCLYLFIFDKRSRSRELCYRSIFFFYIRATCYLAIVLHQDIPHTFNHLPVFFSYNPFSMEDVKSDSGNNVIDTGVVSDVNNHKADFAVEQHREAVASGNDDPKLSTKRKHRIYSALEMTIMTPTDDRLDQQFILLGSLSCHLDIIVHDFRCYHWQLFQCTTSFRAYHF